jgi:tRNA(Ile)-lysidine synthase
MGLQGIPAQYDKITRPMLNIPQADIAYYAQTHQLAWREDSSNAQDKYTRNFLRHNIVPLLKQLNPNLEATFANTLERLQGYASHFQASTEALRAQVVQETPQATYLHIMPLLAQTAGKVFVAELLQPYQFQYEQVQHIWQKMQEKAIGTLFFSPTHSLVIDRETIVLKPKNSESPQTYLLAQGQASLQTPHFTLSADWQASPDSPTDAQNILVDADTLQFPLVVRHWQAGEFFRPLGMAGKKKKIADFLNDQKVPRNLKPDVWVLCSGEEIVWVMGFRMAHAFRVTEKTQRFAHLRLVKNY